MYCFNEYAKNVEWLQHHKVQYRSITNDMCEAINDFDEVEKLRQCFLSVDPLGEIDIGDGITPMPTFVNKKHVFRAQECYNKIVYIIC
jgi:hypothetical protein